jgi:hypothetical protein
MAIPRSVRLVPLVALLVACDTGVEPRLGSTLDPDGVALAASVLEARSATDAFVTGGAWRDADPGEDRSIRHFSISANRHGGRLTGGYNLVLGSSDIVVRGDVTCLTVAGNRAWVGGSIDEAELPFPPEIIDQITGIAVELVDNGNGSGVDELSDLFLFLAQPGGPQAFCDAAVPGPVRPIDRGNYQVY